jgi:hypothetical protein
VTHLIMCACGVVGAFAHDHVKDAGSAHIRLIDDCCTSALLYSRRAPSGSESIAS